MPRAIWNGVIIAESDDCEVMDDNQYFPRAAVNSAYLAPSETHTYCPWKGDCSYYHVVVDGVECQDGAWYYPVTTVDTAKRVEDRIAFWHGVTVEV